MKLWIFIWNFPYVLLRCSLNGRAYTRSFWCFHADLLRALLLGYL
jgi:hypothetical protein